MLKFFEVFRIVILIIGFFLAYFFQAYALFFLLLLVALPLHFTHCVESTFYASDQARLEGKEHHKSYQLQNGYFWLTMAIMVMFVLIMPVGKGLGIMLYCITLLFLFFFSIGYLFEIFGQTNKSIKHYLIIRFLLAITIIIVSIPILISLFKQSNQT